MTEKPTIFSGQKFNIFNQAEVPSIVLCNPNKEELYAIDRMAYNMKLNLRYNALSEFTFSMPKSIDGNLTTIKAYSYIKPKRLIKIEDIGYFIITTAEEEDEGAVPIINVQCQSLESELLYKRLTGYSVTSVKFYSPGDTTTLLEKMISLCPTWSVDYVSPTLANKYRSFETSDTNVYSFMMNDVSKAYDCVFTFNTIDKKISAYLISDLNVGNDTGIFLSYDNLVKNSTLSELSDELATALYGYGGNDLDIRPVNPMLGAVYNFDYYIQFPDDPDWHSEWMSDELRQALLAWKIRLKLVEDGNTSTTFSEYVNYNTALANVKTNLDYTEGYLNNPTLATALSLLDSKSILARLSSELAVIEAKLKIEVNQNIIDDLNAEKTAKEAEIVSAKNKVEVYAALVDKFITRGAKTTSTVNSIYKTLSVVNVPLVAPLKLSSGQEEIYKAINVYKYFISVYKSELSVLEGEKPKNTAAISAKTAQINTWKDYLNYAGGVENTAVVNAKPYTLKLVNNAMYRSIYSTGLVTDNAIVFYLPFSTLVSNLRDCNYSIASYQTQLSEYRAEYAALEVSLSAAIEAKLETDTISADMVKKQAQIDNVSDFITDAQTLLDLIQVKLEQSRDYVILTNQSYFSTELQKELTPFIIENTYQNENIIITDSMGSGEIQAQAQELYDQTKVVLAKASQPRFEFTFDIVNFITLYEYKKFTDQVDLGKSVTVETSSGYVTAVLLEMEILFDKPEEASFTFSNRFRLDNGKFQYSDLFGEVVKTGGSVSYGKLKWDNFDSNYRDDVNQFINSALDASKNNVISASNQQIVINESGLQGKKYDSETNTYAQEQVWMTSNTLAFTKDAWSTASLAIGKITVGTNTDGSDKTAYGIVGDYIVGKVLLGSNLRIQNDGNSVSIDNLGIIVNASNATSQISKVTIDTANGITIANSTGVNVFKTDSSGNLTLTGNIESSGGNIAGWKIETNKISSTSTVGNESVVLKSNWDAGDTVFKIGTAFRVDSEGNGFFAGNVSAKNIKTGTDTNKVDHGTFDGSGLSPNTVGAGKLPATGLKLNSAIITTSLTTSTATSIDGKGTEYICTTANITLYNSAGTEKTLRFLHGLLYSIE